MAQGHQPRSVVDQRDKVRLAQLPLVRHARAVHHIAVPDPAGELGGEAALLLGQMARARDLRQAVLAQQSMRGRARQGLAGHHAGGLEQAHDLSDRVARVIALGRQHRLLDRRGDLGAATVVARLGLEPGDAILAPGVVPSLDRLLAKMAALGVGDGVFA